MQSNHTSSERRTSHVHCSEFFNIIRKELCTFLGHIKFPDATSSSLVGKPHTFQQGRRAFHFARNMKRTRFTVTMTVMVERTFATHGVEKKCTFFATSSSEPRFPGTNKQGDETCVHKEKLMANTTTLKSFRGKLQNCTTLICSHTPLLFADVVQMGSMGEKHSRAKKRKIPPPPLKSICARVIDRKMQPRAAASKLKDAVCGCTAMKFFAARRDFVIQISFEFHACGCRYTELSPHADSSRFKRAFTQVRTQLIDAHECLISIQQMHHSKQMKNRVKPSTG